MLPTKIILYANELQKIFLKKPGLHCNHNIIIVRANAQLEWNLRTSLVAQIVKCLPTMQETRVQSRVGKIPWRKQWQPTPVLLPGKSHGQRSLVGYSPWGRKE